MSTVRTYFQDRLPPDQLARLVPARERFFLENIVDLDSAVAAIQSHCHALGLTTLVRKQPYNAGPSRWDLTMLLPSWIGAIAMTLFSASTPRGQQADVIIKLRSNSLLEVCFSRPAPKPGNALP